MKKRVIEVIAFMASMIGALCAALYFVHLRK